MFQRLGCSPLPYNSVNYAYHCTRFAIFALPATDRMDEGPPGGKVSALPGDVHVRHAGKPRARSGHPTRPASDLQDPLGVHLRRQVRIDRNAENVCSTSGYWNIHCVHVAWLLFASWVVTAAIFFVPADHACLSWSCSALPFLVLTRWRQRGSLSRGRRGAVHRCGSLHVRSPQGMRGTRCFLLIPLGLSLACFSPSLFASRWVA